MDELLGPVAISVKREKVSDELPEFYGIPASVGPTGMPKHQYRVILRTSEVWWQCVCVCVCVCGCGVCVVCVVCVWCVCVDTMHLLNSNEQLY